MKTNLFLLCAFFSWNLEAQYFIRTKKNLGVVSMYNYGQNERLSTSAQFGLCKQFGRYTIPEIGFKIQQNNDIMEPYSLFTGIQFRKNLIKLNSRKKGAKCMAELLEGFVTPEFQYVLPNTNIQTQAPFSIRYGLGIYHAESGGSRRSSTWEAKVEVYHRNFLGGSTSNQQEFGIALRIQHFKSYDFLK